MGMAGFPRRFVWLEKDDRESSHLDLKEGQVYSSGSIGSGLLLKWAKGGKIKFLQDEGGTLTPDVVLQIQDATIAPSADNLGVKNG